MGDASDAISVSSGEVWRVAPFVRDDLYTQAPATVGTAPLAGEQGAVANGRTVSWILTPQAIEADSLFLEVRAIIGDGVQYHNLYGAVPPALVVHCQ